MTAFLAVFTQGVAPARATDDFFTYAGPVPTTPGTVLDYQSPGTYTVTDLAGSVTVGVTQVLYSSRDAWNNPVVNVTSVLRPAQQTHPGQVVSYQSYYDSLDPEESPSRSLSGSTNPAAGRLKTELNGVAMLLRRGYNVVVTDIEGQHGHFAVGTEYGLHTLYALRALSDAPIDYGISPTSEIALMGYSGGAIATNWAASLAAQYAPSIAPRLIGQAAGGMVVHPDHNLNYVSGSKRWAGVIPLILVGLSRATPYDLSQYLNAYGQAEFARLQNESPSIYDLDGAYNGKYWTSFSYLPNPEHIPELVALTNALNLGTRPVPAIPAFFAVGSGGWAVGSNPSLPDIGAGDGVAVAGDVRALANKYCAAQVPVHYEQYSTEHVGASVKWLLHAEAWVLDRFSGVAPPSDCGNIAAGNSLAPVTVDNS